MLTPPFRTALITFTRVLPAVLWLALASGCGNKGDLVLPDAPPEMTESADSGQA